MKTRIFAIAIFAIAFVTNANAQNPSADATVTANATVVTPISLTAGDDMEFGLIIASASGGTVAVDTSGALIGTGVTSHASSVGSAASFTVAGETGFGYDVTMPAPFNLSNGLNTMSVGSFTHFASGVLTTGSELFKVGATLTVGANQPAGFYTNSSDFTVTVNYN